MRAWGSHSAGNGWRKISKRKKNLVEIMKCGRGIFFARGLYNNPVILVGPFRVSRKNLLKGILYIIFRFLMYIVFGISRAKMMEYDNYIFVTMGMYNRLGNFAGHFGASLVILM